MITIVAGTNRRKNVCQIFAQAYKEMIETAGNKAQILSLDQVPVCLLHADMYENDGQDPQIIALQDQYITAADKYLFIAPEYNGSIPGALKLFIDAISVRNYHSNFKNKGSMLTGIASGRAGNLRGLDHLTSILMHMGGMVHPNKVPFSAVETLLDENATINDPTTLEIMQQQVTDLINM